MMKMYLLPGKNYIFVVFTIANALFIDVTAHAQLVGTKSIPGDYASMALAVADLNAVGVGAGGVTFNVAAGHTETSDIPVISATGTMANPIVFQKSGAGANPKVTPLTAGTVASNTSLGAHGDGIIILNGGDYLTFDGIDVQTDAAFAGSGMYEYGYYFIKASGTDACKNVTIRNCNITLNKAAIYSFGVFVSNISGTTSVTVTSIGGRSENIRIYNATISNAYGGIQLRGFNHTSSPFDFYDQQIWVGEDGANTISNYGGGASTTYAIYAIYQNDLKINNNTISGGDNTTTTHWCIFLSTATNSNAEIDNNTISINNNATTSQVVGIGLSTGTITGTTNTLDVTNNSITNISRPAATSGVTYFIYSTSNNPLNLNITGNTIGSSNLQGSGTVYGINQSGGSPVNITIADNGISSISRTTASTNSLYGINCENTSATTQTTISGNIIHAISGVGSTGVAGGISTATQTTVNVSKNKIYDLTCDHASGTVYGLNLGSGVTTYNVSNNLIADLKAPNTNSISDPVRGINVPTTSANSTVNLSFNTIFLNATSTGVDFTTCGLFTSSSSTPTSATLQLRNNIIINISTPSGAGKTIAFKRNSTSFGNYGSASNNNLFYAGTPGSANLIYFDGVFSDQTLAGFKARVDPRDAVSVTENPTFLSTSGASVNFLHIDSAVPTQIESGGVPVGGITDDYDGNARNSTFPDIGADEGAFTPMDLTGPLITYTPLGNTCTPGTVTLNALITDPGGVPVSGIGLPVLYWKINSGSYTAATATHISGNMYQFSFGAGSVASDVVSYYIVAQDNGGTPNINASPLAGASGYSANPPAVITPPTTPKSYTVLITLTGTYTVGAGGNYATLTAAISDYNTKCISGSVIFSLTDATYGPSETFPVSINFNTSAGPTNTLTIRPAAGVAATISGTSGTSPSGLIRLNGAKYVIFDGVNSGGSSLIVENTSVTPGTAVFWLSSNGEGAGASNNTIQKCNIRAGITQHTSSSTSYGIVLAGNSLSATVTSVAAGSDNDNNTLNGNVISKCRYGIYSRGGSTTNPNTGTIISGNIIGPSLFGTESIGKCGILAREEDGLQITGNEIRYIGGYYAIQSAGSDRVAIALATDAIWPPTAVYVKNAVIAKNVIHDVVEERTFSAIGIAIAASDGPNATNNLAANNILYEIKCNGTGSDQTIGIGLSAANGDVIAFNTIYLTGDTDPNGSASTPTVSSFGVSISSSSVSNPSVKDNIIWMDLISSNAPSLKHACLNIPSSFAWGTGSSNYNDLYITPANTQANIGCVGGSGGTFYSTLAAWQAAVTQDANSLNIMPVFISPTNLHLDLIYNVGLNDFGTPVTGVTMDIDMDTRDAMDPDMGADEFTPTFGLDVGIQSLSSPPASGSSGCFTSAETVKVILKNYSANPIDLAVNNVTVTVTATGGYNSNLILSSGSLFPGSSMIVTMPATIDMSVNGTYTFNSYTTLVGDVTPGNDAMPPTNRVVFAMEGTYLVGAGQGGSGGYETLTAAVSDYNTCPCLAGPVTFALTDANYGTAETFPITINRNLDANATNTLTIKPNVSSTISGSNTSAIIVLNAATYVTIDGSTSSTANTICPLSTASRNLTIRNTHTSLGTAVVWIQNSGSTGATHNTIKNCKVAGNSNTTTLVGIGSGSSSISTSSLGLDNDNNSYINNEITKAQYGIYSQGASTANKNTGTVIRQNLMHAVSPDNLGIGGIWVGFESGIDISGNRIENIASGSGTLSSFGIAVGIGASFSNATSGGNQVTDGTITHNSINNIRNTATRSAAGITLSSATSGTNLIANNMISGVSANGTSTNFCTGILLGGGTGSTTNVFYNTVVMNGTIQGATAGTSQSFALSITNSTAPTVDIRNNILINTQLPNAGGSTKFYAIGLAYSSTPGNYAGLTSDNNDLFATNASNYHVGITGGLSNGTVRTTLANWQTETGRDLSSQNINPVFNSPSDVHIFVGDAVNMAIDSTAAVLTVTDDIDCETRNMTMPDIGADEFTIVFCSGALGGTASGSTSFCVSGTPVITAAGYSIGVGSTYQWQSSVNPGFTTPIDIPGQTNPASLTTGVVSATTYYRLKVTCDMGMAVDYSTIVTITVNPLPTATLTPSGNVGICPPVTSQLLTANTNAASPQYVWEKNGAVIMGETGSTYSAITTGAYMVMITDAITTCSNTSAATNITFYSAPATPVITPDPAEICAGGPALLLQVTNGSGTGTGVVTQSSGAISQAIPDNHSTGTSHNLTTSGIPAGATIDSIIVTVNITHTFDGDIEVMLQAPNGQILNLIADQGSSGDHFTNTRITSNNTFPALSTGTPPFTSTFRADAKTQATLIGLPAVTTQSFNDLFTVPNGQWTLRAYDDDPTIVGALTGWSITINYTAPSLTWIPNGPGNGLYLDAAATMIYNGADTNQVYALPSTTTTYTVTAETTFGCISLATVEVTVHSIVVSNTNDSGDGSLRDIIDCVAGGSIITFAPSLMGQTITLSSGEIVINKNLTLSGLGMLDLTISGNNTNRIFHLPPGKNMTIENMTLKNASAMSNGGAVWVEGNLTLENVLFENNLENGSPKSLTIVSPGILETVGIVEIKE